MALPDRDSPPVVHAREADLPDPPAAPNAHPRAGRNLPLATGVALLLAGLLIVTLLTWRPLFVGFVAILVAVATLELRSALAQQEIRLPYEPLLVGGPAMVVAAYARGPLGLCVAFALTVIGVQVWRLLGGQQGYVRDTSAGLFVASYLPFLAAFAALLAVGPYGPEQVVLLVALVVCCDTGGYVAGVTMGKHPMAPRISPKKSWEGFAGSVTATVVAGALAASVAARPAVVGGRPRRAVRHRRGRRG